MTTLVDERASIKSLLEAQGLYVADDMGEPAVPPVVFIDRDNPYVVLASEEATFDSQFAARFRVLVVLDVGTNDQLSDDFDQAILDVAAAFRGYGIDITQVSAPLAIDLNTASYVGVEVLIDVGTNLKE